MEFIKGTADVVAIPLDGTPIELSGEDGGGVFGYNVFVDPNSANEAWLSINSGPSMTIGIGAAGFSLGGFAIGDNPVIYADQVKVTFKTDVPIVPGTNANSAFIVMTKIKCP